MDARAQIEVVYRGRHDAFVAALSGIVGSRDAARDVTHDAFVRALQRSHTFRGGSLEAWIWKIALNRARDARRRVVPEQLPELIAPDLPMSDGALVAAVLALPERRRTIVLLRHVAGLKNREIAEALGVAPGTVAATLSQARDALGDALDQEGAATWPQ
jgi:RNA polymerase sigma factor (sigma-70 family)